MTLAEAKEKVFDLQHEIESLENQLERTRSVPDIAAIQKELRKKTVEKIKYEMIVERGQKNAAKERS